MVARLKNILGDTDGVSTISVSEWWLETEEHVGGHGWCVCVSVVSVSDVSVVPRD